ncbi:hypothetical protein Dester_0688 [Desulfurobacterium thermolithotrophum DSM 11699]|uniref:Uncharacterized protein n=1 Tax=Desulfurobacterium thermolithotrophum (strain DSM 11699 / BSA) TaxID=868864 RepID=F0S3B3_DESTD|nr:hypothetical protein Dester_0688 [Desulfurobacterium thermolithotrophum DSM 11699]
MNEISFVLSLVLTVAFVGSTVYGIFKTIKRRKKIS